MGSPKHNSPAGRSTGKHRTGPRRNDNSVTEQPHDDSAGDPLYRRACRLMQNGKYCEAVGLLNAGGVTDAFKNLKGVCLLRMGQTDSAIRVLRSLVLQPGTTWARPGLPVIYHTNYCTALFLGGHSRGCVDLLADITDQQHPAVLQLKQTLETWMREMSFWQKLQWWCGMEPDHPARLDHPPGDYEILPIHPDSPGSTERPPGPRVAA